MPLRAAKPLTFRPRGLSDAVDGSNAFAGAMQSLQNLIPDPSTKGVWVPRPGSIKKTVFAGFTTPTQITALLIIGTKAWGMVSTARNAGKDEPFCYDLSAAAFIAISGVTSANSPTSPATSGDWTPPCMAQVGSRIVITHPGYAGGGGPFFGWIDISGLVSNSITGTTHTTTTVDTLSANVLQAGWNIGDTITGTDIPANTTIVSIAANGLSIVISNAATGGHAGVTFTVSGGTAAAPLYNAGNTNGFPLSAVPVSVAQFNGRAWFAVGTGVVYSDALNATQVTNASQALTFANGLMVTCVAGLPLSSPVTGGMIQSLIAFQGDNAMAQITGDAATTNLAVNFLNISTGTLAPNTVTPTPLGLAFIAPDGLRIISFGAQVSDPIGSNGDGVVVPFENANHPSRMCACYNQDVLRVSVQNNVAPSQPWQEYWLDLTLKVWSGPHTFPAALIEPLQTAANSFLIAPIGQGASLWESDVIPNISSVYTENALPMPYIYWTVLMPDNESMAMNAVAETTLAIDVSSSGTIVVNALDETGVILGTLNLMGDPAGLSLWGTFVWGVDPWRGGATFFEQIALNWTQQLIFKQMSLRVAGSSVAGFAIGNLYLKYQVLGYQLQRVS